MHDSYLFLTPLLTLLVVALVGFVGCDSVFSVDHVDDIPEGVKNFMATPGNQQVVLTWEARAGATLYTISMRITSDNSTESRTLPAGETSYVWGGLMNNVEYCFTISATTPDGETPKSEERCVTPSLQGIVTNFITGKTLGTTRNDFSGWVGIRFTLEVDVIALSLGRINAPGNSAPHMVKLVHAVDAVTKTDVPGAVVTVMPNTGTPDEFVYVDLPAQVPLSKGNQYYLVSQEQLNGDLFYNNNTAVTTTNITLAAYPVFGTNLGVYSEVMTQGFEYGPVDFKYSVS